MRQLLLVLLLLGAAPALAGGPDAAPPRLAERDDAPRWLRDLFEGGRERDRRRDERGGPRSCGPRGGLCEPLGGGSPWRCTGDRRPCYARDQSCECR
jgi:hypothetical protein